MTDADRPEPVESPLIAAATAGSAVMHGFFSRKGGVSQGIYRGLNVGIGSADDRERVMENRARVSRWFALAPDRLATLHQVHSPEVQIVTMANWQDRPKADGMVTRQPGIVLGVLAADCGPVLFADPQAGVIGAAHAGWRGALDGVLEATVDAMERLGAVRGRIVACLGPSISQDNYEVGPEFIDRFLARDPDHARWFRTSDRSGHAMFDLRGLSLARLAKAGLRAEKIDACTYIDEARWYSYRRTTHRAEPDYGRQISAIALREDDHGPAL